MADGLRVLGIDPGSEKSACVLYDVEPPSIAYLNILPSREAVDLIYTLDCDAIVVEMVQHYGQGMPVGREIFDTCVWIGEMRHACLRRWGDLNKWYTIQRPTVKGRLCGSATASDSNIRQALIDRFGGDSVAIGNKKCRKCKGKGWFGAGRPVCFQCKGSGWRYPPGPLAEVHDDLWAALGVAVAWTELNCAPSLAKYRARA